LEESVEQQPAAGGGAAVEAEGELVEVVGQLFPNRSSFDAARKGGSAGNTQVQAA
jgi:hypothetical protein